MTNQEENKNRRELTDEELEQVSGGTTWYGLRCKYCGPIGDPMGSTKIDCWESIANNRLDQCNNEGCPLCGALNSTEIYYVEK